MTSPDAWFLLCAFLAIVAIAAGIHVYFARGRAEAAKAAAAEQHAAERVAHAETKADQRSADAEQRAADREREAARQLERRQQEIAALVAAKEKYVAATTALNQRAPAPLADPGLRDHPLDEKLAKAVDEAIAAALRAGSAVDDGLAKKSVAAERAIQEDAALARLCSEVAPRVAHVVGLIFQSLHRAERAGLVAVRDSALLDPSPILVPHGRTQPPQSRPLARVSVDEAPWTLSLYQGTVQVDASSARIVELPAFYLQTGNGGAVIRLLERSVFVGTPGDRNPRIKELALKCTDPDELVTQLAVELIAANRPAKSSRRP